jgi:hypothetical protein
MKDCYERWLELSPGIAGKMVVGFTIAPDPNDASRGRVIQAEVGESGLDHTFIEGCVLNALGGLAFDRPSDGQPIKVKYPFQFTSTDGGASDAGYPY